MRTGKTSGGEMGCGASNGTRIVTTSSYMQTEPWNFKPLEASLAACGTFSGVDEDIECDVPVDETQSLIEAEVAPHVGFTQAKAKPKPTQKEMVEATWLAVCDPKQDPKGDVNKSLVVKRTGWKTIRIFVSSTFKDMYHEREVLVKEIFPDLRVWCEARRLHLVECDLRWGVPKDSTTELTLRTCLGEIDRCYQDNVMPYFLNMTSERIGWVPEPGEVPQNLVDEYRWVFGLSVTEMEIVHGAYRKDNPNSLFMIRDDSFLNNMPPNMKKIFVDENPIAPCKLDVLRQNITDKFPEDRVVGYTCDYLGMQQESQKPKLQLDPVFREKVFEFFKKRIDQQYPLVEEGKVSVYEKQREAHEAFMKSRSDTVLGRANILEQIREYICGIGNDVPLLVLGGPGTGKSSIISKASDETVKMAFDKAIPGGGGQSWHVFYHFIGAVPGSTDLARMLQRLMVEVGVCVEEDLPSDMETLVQLTCSALNNTNTRPVAILIDALNQLDEEEAAKLMTWVPRKLAPQVRCVFSMINDTPPHENLGNRESKPIEIIVKPLDLAIRKDMVMEYMGKFNKRLDLDQMISLLNKAASENPLWLSIACEELRVFGEFRKLGDKINNLADDLLDLLQQVLSRFEQEGGEAGGILLRATLCLLETSLTGLLESELLAVLADEDNLMPSPHLSEKGMKEKSEKGFKACGNLPAFKWAGIYRSLRPFLRPFGDSGEGRLDFYHRSLSKAVRKKYLGERETAGKLSAQYKWWHSKLADYFAQSENIDRKVEEYPHHLITLMRTKELEDFLGQWSTFDRLYDREFSTKFLKYWRECGAVDRIMECYSEMLQTLKNNPETTEYQLADRYQSVSRLLVQAGAYDPALLLANEAMALEVKLGSRPEKMADLYSHLAHIMDQKIKLIEFCTGEQLPDQRKAINYNQLAIDTIEKNKLSGRFFETLLATQYMKLAFGLAGVADCHGDAELTVEEALERGNVKVDIAIKKFTEMKDKGHLAEAIMTKAVLCRGNKSSQLKYYEKAMEICKETYGHYHVLTGRLLMNTGICHEDFRDYQKAYDHFRGVYLINYEVYGADHIKTKRNKSVLCEDIYKRIANQRKDTLIMSLKVD